MAKSHRLLRLAIMLAEQSHHGQLYNREPYINHPKRVASSLTDEIDKIVALLHDVVEDTGVTILDVLRSFGKDIADAVDAITRRGDERYFDYIRRAATNPIALRVKIADLEENIAQSYSADAPDNAESLRVRYLKALDILKSV